MKITFSLLKAPAKAALQQGQKSFDERGGSIGRGDSNTWVLPDPDKFLSSKHCVVTCEQGQFYITDTSTNGLFLNGASLPIGRNNKVSVSEGDTLDLGEYRLRIALEKSGAKVSPFAQLAPAEPEPAMNIPAQWGALEPTPQATDGADLFAASGHAGGDPFYDASMDPFAAKDPFGLSASHSAESFPPADLFPPDAAGKGNPFSSDPFSADPFGGQDPFAPSKPKTAPTFTQNEGGNPLHDAISLPKVAPAQGGPAIPDDFWNSLGGPGSDALGMPSQKPLNPFASDDPLAPAKPDPFAAAPKPTPVAPPKIPPPEVPAAPVQAPDALGENPFAHLSSASTAPQDLEGQLYPQGSAFSTLVPATTPGKVPLSERLKAMQQDSAESLFGIPLESQIPPQTVAPVQPIAPVQPVAPISTTPPVQPHAVPPPPRAPQQPAPAIDTGTNNLVAALGLSGQLSLEQEQVLPQLIGEITREALSGLLQILRARNSIKNEFRIAVTTIQPRENNPIKFATDVDDALELLFVRASKGYKPPVESVQDSFESIMDHQVAILAGIRAAFKSLLTRFDPVHLEQQFERQGKTGGILPGMKGAKAWSAYDDFYQELIGNFENSFQNLFGDEFVQAYEEQLRKLAIARKLEHSQR